MSTASKVVLGVSVVLTLSTVAGVHLQQSWEREVRTEPSQPVQYDQLMLASDANVSPGV